MKYSTLKVRSKSLKILDSVADNVRSGERYIISPLIVKTIKEAGDYLYFKEHIKNTNTFTTKSTAYTYVKVLSNKVVNVQELEDIDYNHLNCKSKEDFIKYYDNLIIDMSNDLTNKVSASRLLKQFNYDNNPCIELLELEIVDIQKN